MKDTYYLFKSDKPTKKFVMVMPSHRHLHYFGQIKSDGTPYRDFTLMNNKKSIHYEPDKDKRNKIKENYHKRHANEKGGRHTPSSMSKIILWGKPTFKSAIKDYEKTFNVKVIFKDTKLTDEIQKKLLL